ncbi:hypothetical protein ABZP36_035829 [Zizania latifolia]
MKSGRFLANPAHCFIDIDVDDLLDEPEALVHLHGRPGHRWSSSDSFTLFDGGAAAADICDGVFDGMRGGGGGQVGSWGTATGAARAQIGGGGGDGAAELPSVSWLVMELPQWTVVLLDVELLSSWKETRKGEILDTNPQLYFHLQQQKLINLIHAGKIDEALEFAQEELDPRGEENIAFLDEIEKTVALLVFEDIKNCPYGELLDVCQRLKTASEVNAAILISQSREKGNGHLVASDNHVNRGRGGPGMASNVDAQKQSTGTSAVGDTSLHQPVGLPTAIHAASVMASILGGVQTTNVQNGFPVQYGLGNDPLTHYLARMSRYQLYEIMSELKSLSTQNKELANKLLQGIPQLPKALFQAQIMLGMVTSQMHVEVPIPAPKDGGVLINMEAGGINTIDWKLQKGMLWPFLPKKFPFVPACPPLALPPSPTPSPPTSTPFSAAAAVRWMSPLLTAAALGGLVVLITKKVSKNIAWRMVYIINVS